MAIEAFDIQALLAPPDIMHARRALCVQPHPDDVEIGMGGIVAALAAAGCEIAYRTATNGDLGNRNRADNGITGSGVEGDRFTAIALSLLGGALMLCSFLGFRERADFSQLPQPKLRDSLKSVTLNRNFWLVSTSHFFYDATTGLLLAGIPFFIIDTLSQPDRMATVLSASVFVSAIPTMYLWYRLINRLGTLRVWRITLLWLAGSLGVMLFAKGIGFASAAGVLVGACIAGVTANLDMVNMERIEADARN